MNFAKSLFPCHQSKASPELALKHDILGRPGDTCDIISKATCLLCLLPNGKHQVGR